MKKLLLLLLCVLAASGCSRSRSPASSFQSSAVSWAPPIEDPVGSAAANTEFEQFLDEYVIEICEQDYSTAHHYFEHPEQYGIDLAKCRITLGTILPDPQETDFLKKTIEILESWADEDLSRSNRQIRRQLLWQLQLSLDTSQSRFQYLDNIWAPTSGILSSLTDFFSEYQLYSQEDIAPLIELIHEVPSFAAEALEYSKTQAQKKLLAFDLDSVRETCRSILDSRADSPVTRELFEEVDTLALPEAEAKACKQQISQALNDSFFPSFETILSGLEALEPEIRDIQGMASFPSGKEYYEYLVRYNSGSNQSVEEIRDEIIQALDATVKEYEKIVRKNPEAPSQAWDAKTRFDSIEQILPFLNERYPAAFPVVDEMDYEVKELSPEQSVPGIVAYFVVPPIDSERPYEIRYNGRDNTTDPDSLSLYDTFAHEGIPGHMYQTQYNREHFHHPAQYFLFCMGMQEGYATYAASQTLPWSGVKEEILQVYELAEQYSNYSVLLMDIQINYDGYSLKEFTETWGEDLQEVYLRLAESPATFFGYYYGSLKILELQTIARESLGSEYDDVAFNTALLEAGNVEFSIVEQNIQDYINSVRNRLYGNPQNKEQPSVESESLEENPLQDSRAVQSAQEEEMLEENS